MNNKKTYTPTKKDLKPDWLFIDAKDKVLGMLASEIASKLIGKHKAIYTTNINVGDKVVVTNAKEVVLTKNKWETKLYRRHTGFPGGVKTETAAELRERRPTEVLKRAIKRMLPQNKLTKERMRNLYIYEGSEHPHEAQEKAKE